MAYSTGANDAAAHAATACLGHSRALQQIDQPIAVRHAACHGQREAVRLVRVIGFGLGLAFGFGFGFGSGSGLAVRLAGGGGALDGPTTHATAAHRQPAVCRQLCEELLEAERDRLVRVKGER